MSASNVHEAFGAPNTFAAGVGMLDLGGGEAIIAFDPTGQPAIDFWNAYNRRCWERSKNSYLGDIPREWHGKELVMVPLDVLFPPMNPVPAMRADDV